MLPKNKRYHYTYILEAVNPLGNERFYIGVRSCNKHPTEDGCYMSSSRSVATAIAFGVAFKKNVLAIWPSREEAVAHEVRLHEFLNVSTDPSYFNKAKQTTVKFDTGGTTYSTERIDEQRNNSLSAWSDPYKRERIYAGQIASYQRDEVRVNRRRSAVEHWRNPETRQKNIDSLKKSLSSPEARAIKSARMREQWELKRSARLALVEAAREFCAIHSITKPGKGYCSARNHPAFAAFIESRGNR